MEPDLQDLVNIPDEYLCPIMRTIMVDPVITVDGYTFQRKSIKQWFARGHWKNPLTGLKLGSRTLIPNIVLKKLTTQFREDLPKIQKQQQEEADLNYILSQLQEWHKNDLDKRTIKQILENFTEEMKAFKEQFEEKKHHFGGKSSFEGGQYQGQKHIGVPNGVGIHFCQDGGRYEGSFKNGKRSGKGVAFYCNGDRFQGQFFDGAPNGFGISYSVDGSRYQGCFKNYCKEGKGIFFSSNGEFEEQEWKNGNKI